MFRIPQTALDFRSLGLNPLWFRIPLPFTDWSIPIRWYAMSYLFGVLLGWWYLLRLLSKPGAPMTKRQADEFPSWAMIGIVLGGRIAYLLFYARDDYLADPLSAFKLWEGGMSFHGGVIGVATASLLFSRSNGLSWLRVTDYVAATVPIGLFLGRLANFNNGELWGRPTDVPWAIVFPTGGPLPRHPSQLYEAALEGLVLFAILWWLFWKTDARDYPGRLMGAFTLGYGTFRFIVEYFREPDAQLGTLNWGLTMGQTLCLPMIAGGLYLLAASCWLALTLPLREPGNAPREGGIHGISSI